jgi:hypothetical protein
MDKILICVSFIFVLLALTINSFRIGYLTYNKLVEQQQHYIVPTCSTCPIVPDKICPTCSTCSTCPKSNLLVHKDLYPATILGGSENYYISIKDAQIILSSSSSSSSSSSALYNRLGNPVSISVNGNDNYLYIQSPNNLLFLHDKNIPGKSGVYIPWIGLKTSDINLTEIIYVNNYTTQLTSEIFNQQNKEQLKNASLSGIYPTFDML